MPDAVPEPLKNIRYISPSQIKQAGQCGWLYELERIQKLKPAKRAVAFLTGSVLHRAAEKWCMDHTLDLVDLTRAAWMELATTNHLVRTIKAYGNLSSRSVKLQKSILKKRPDIKSPTLTKDFKSSIVGKAVADFNGQWAKVLGKDEHNWEGTPFTTAYDGTIACADNYQQYYQGEPEDLVCEMRFQMDWEGLPAVGAIDSIRYLMTPGDEEIRGYLIQDRKTGTRVPASLRDFVQLATYHAAASQHLPTWLDAAGLPYLEDLPIFVGLDLMRPCIRTCYEMTPQALQQARLIAGEYDRWRNAELYLPDFAHCDMCDHQEDCEKRVGLIPVDNAAA